MKIFTQVFAVLCCCVSCASWAGDSGEERPISNDLGLAETPRAVTEYWGTVNYLFADGRVFIAGQPDQEALKAFGKRGVGVVVNLRTPEEMADLEEIPFDEEQVVTGAGMEYVSIPLGGEDHPYRTAAVDEFSAVLDRHAGPVLVHCRSAVRASYLWVSYLVVKRGFPLEEALSRGEKMRLRPSPLEGLLDRDLNLVYADGS